MSHSGAKLDPILNVLPLPVFAVDRDCRVLEANAAAIDFCGTWSKDDLLQRDFLQVLIADEDKAETRVKLKEVLEGHDDGHILKVTAVSRAGRKQTCLKAAPTRGESGKINGAVISVQDMSEVKALAGTAADAGGAEHLSGALAATGLAVFCIDKECKILEWTPKLEKLSGYIVGQAKGKEATFCVSASFQRSMKKGLDQALRGLDIPRFNVSIEHASGKTKDAWLSVVPWRSATGSIVGAVGSFEDAAEVDRRLGEADWIRTAAAEQLDRANAAIFSIDSNLCVTEWNHLLADRSGEEKEKVAGTKLLDLLGAESRSRAETAANAALAGEFGQAVRITLAPAMEMLVGFSPQFSFTGKVIGALAVGQILPSGDLPGATRSTDVTNHRMKGRILHELRTPLHGILGLSNTISQEPGPMQKPLGMISLSAERVVNMITNLMDFWNFSDAEVRSAEKQGEMVDLSVLAQDCITKCEAFKDKRGKPLKKDKVELKTNLQSVTISGDGYALTQMMIQILLNAYKFTADGEVNFTVEEDKEKQCAVITISDTGVGMKLESGDRKFDGIGVGLAMVREVARIHHGSIRFEPPTGKGAVVKVTLPFMPPSCNGFAAASTQEEDKQESKKVPLPGTKPRGPPSSWLGPSTQIGIQINARPSPPMEGGSATASSLPALKEGMSAYNFEDAEGQNLIMSVDDDFVNQEVMRSILEPSGFQVITCMSGTECLEYLDADNPRPQLLLLDLMMPGLSGFDVLQALQSKFQLGELPVIMVSAKNQSSSVVKGYELGCTDWIHKPFCRQELIARVKSHLKMRGALLSFRRSFAHEPSQENIGQILEEDGTPQTPRSQSDKEKPAAEEQRKGSVDSTALFANVTEAPEDDLISIFEAFEKLSTQHATLRTEIVGRCYVAVGKDDGTHHTDSMLLLAQQMLQTVSKAQVHLGIGIHTDSKIPAVLRGREKSGRRYPTSCLFSPAVQQAKAFSDEAADDRIILSRAARCRLSADAEAEMQKRGLRLLAGDEHARLGKFYYVAKVTEAGANPLRKSAEQAKETAKAHTDGTKQMLNQQMVQEELLQARYGMQQMQQKLLMAEEQIRQARAESGSLRQQLQAQASQAGPQVAPPTASIWSTTADLPSEMKQSKSSQASVLFLQWQNAHLQAEIRHYQQALTNTKSELQMQVLAGQLLESKHHLLQARVEHLELDLGFKAICGSLGQTDELFADLPSLQYKAPTAAGPSLPKDFGLSGLGSPTSGLGLGIDMVEMPPMPAGQMPFEPSGLAGSCGLGASTPPMP